MVAETETAMVQGTNHNDIRRTTKGRSINLGEWHYVKSSGSVSFEEEIKAEREYKKNREIEPMSLYISESEWCKWAGNAFL